MTVIISALAFLLLLSFLVLIHELGHFFAARNAGVVVEEFGFGLPPRAKKLFKKSGTLFSLNWIPFGGFVRLQGESATSERDRRTAGNFAHASIPQRIMILVAGVLMNFLFAIFIFTLGFTFWHWVPTYTTLDDMKQAAITHSITMAPGVTIAKVLPGGTAAEAKVPENTTFLAVNGTDVYIPGDVVNAQKGKTSVTYLLQSNNADKTQVTVVVPVRDGKTGIEIDFQPRITAPNHDFPHAVLLSLREAGVTTVQTIFGIAHLFTSLLLHAAVPEGITGIVGIAQITHVTVQLGILSYLRLMAGLSLSLAIINILPFPSLDGGRLLFVMIEAIAQRPAPRKFELVTNTIGFFVLILLIVLVTANDIWKLL